MTAPGRPAAAQVVYPELESRRQSEAVVAALDAAKLLRRPDEAAYVAALEVVAEAARPVAGYHHSAERHNPLILALAALDAVPAAETGSGESLRTELEAARARVAETEAENERLREDNKRLHEACMSLTEVSQRIAARKADR